MKPIIDIYSPFAISIVELIRHIGWTREANRWMLAAILIALCWFFLAYKRNFGKPKDTWYFSNNVFIATLLVGVFILRLSVVIYSHIDVDESDWIAGAATLYDDPRFWYSVDGTTSGPLVIMPLALIPLLGGSLSYVNVRILVTLFYLLPSLWFTYHAIKKSFSQSIADVIIIPLALLFGTSASLVPYNGETSIIFLTAICLYMYSNYRELPKYFLVWGIVIGLLAYTKPQAIPIGIMIALIVLWRINSKGIKWQNTAIFIVGGIMPTLMVGAYLLSNHLWDDFFQSYIINNLFYGSSSQGAMGNEYSWAVIIQKIIEYFCFVPAYSYVIFMALLTSSLGIVILFIDRQRLYQYDLLVGILLFFTAIFCCVKPQTYFYHYQNMLLIPAIFLIGAVASWYSKNLPQSSNTLKISATMGYWFIAGIIAGLSSILGDIGGLELDPTKNNIGAVSKAIEQYAKPNEKMAIWGWNTPLFVETGLLQGTRDGHTHYHMSPIKLQTYYINRYLYDLRRNRPKVVVETFAGYSSLVFGKDGRKTFGIEHYPILAKYIYQNYELRQDIEGHTRIFVLKKD